MLYVYIARTDRNTLYIGSTKNLFGRLRFHTLGVGATATKDKPGLRIVYTEKYSTLKDALRRERQLKKWSRAKKEALIRGDLTTLKRLPAAGRCFDRTGRHSKNNTAESIPENFGSQVAGS